MSWTANQPARVGDRHGDRYGDRLPVGGSTPRRGGDPGRQQSLCRERPELSGATTVVSVIDYGDQYGDRHDHGRRRGAPFGIAIQPLSPLPPSEVATTASGLAYSRVTRTFNGTVTITNISAAPISGPLQILFTGLTAGVTLANATGNFSGSSYLTIAAAPASPPATRPLSVSSLQNPSFAPINFTPVIYSGNI